ncbi:MAG: gliding motility-associated C-terminal domain-containing protein [Bacteroidia bacterium]|nr:gliding motility-associated C-terminal domain-containing protein [Bacteroidia bacterium]
MKNDDIDDLFKKSFENYEAEVNPSVWKNIRIGLKWGGLALLFNTLLHKIGFGTIIAILSSAVIISTVAILNKKNKSDDVTQNTKIETQLPPAIIEKPASVLDTTQEQKAENGKPLSEGKNNSTEKTALPANTIVESSKKDNKKIESVINKFSKEPIASISASPVGGTAPLIVDLSNTGSGKTNKWTYSDGKKDKSTSNPVHVFETPGIYSVILTSTNDKGETAIDSIKVEVTGNSSISSIPKDFSPNGDGVLDVFVFQTKNIAKMNAKIFDEKGTVVYTSESTDAKWDGKDLQGNDAKEGIYFYIINAEGVDGKKYEPKGSINLTR